MIATGAGSFLLAMIGLTALLVVLGNSDNWQGSDGIPKSAEALSGVTASRIAGLPLPKQAHWDGPPEGKSADYTIPASFQTVKAWYLDHLPVGQSWRGWSWVTGGQPCTGTFDSAASWQWEQQASTLAITVYPSRADPSFTDVAIYVLNQLPICSPTNP